MPKIKYFNHEEHEERKQDTGCQFVKSEISNVKAHYSNTPSLQFYNPHSEIPNPKWDLLQSSLLYFPPPPLHAVAR
jgi:hypothetical protein